jgi:flagellar basal body-associated protein FliL
MTEGVVPESDGPSPPNTTKVVAVFAALVAAILLFAFVASSDPEDADETDTAVAAEYEPTATTTPTTVLGGGLTKTEACLEAMKISADYRLSDDQTANEFYVLAGQTNDPEVSEELIRLSRAFERGDSAVSSQPLMRICGR